MSDKRPVIITDYLHFQFFREGEFVTEVRSLITSLEEKDQKRRLQLELLEKKAALLQEQLRAEQQLDKGVGILIWSLRLLCALGAGFILGRI